MKLPVPEVNFVPAPEGLHVGICTKIIDLGTQQTNFGAQRTVSIEFQLSGLLNEETGDPFSVWERYRLSGSSKSNLRKMLESWRGKRFTDKEIRDFELRTVLGKPAMVSVEHNGDYADIVSVTTVPKEVTIPQPVGTLVLFSLNAEEFEPEIFESLSDRLKETIQRSPEYQDLVNSTCDDVAF